MLITNWNGTLMFYSGTVRACIASLDQAEVIFEIHLSVADRIPQLHMQRTARSKQVITVQLKRLKPVLQSDFVKLQRFCPVTYF